MKKILFCLLILTGFVANSQVYNNEWIDYSKTYYKFKVGKTGLYRIPQTVLASAGLASAPAEQFQLWRNGLQVPVYTSVSSGALSNNDYIEFWGEMNDGKPDKALYRDPDYQLNDKWSLETDSSTYFLTTTSTGSFRFENTANNVATNVLSAEPYFMYTTGRYFKDRIFAGFAVNVGSYLYSSSYDKAEGWASGDIGTNGTNTFAFSNLFVASGGPAPSFNIAVSGNAVAQRSYRVNINGDSVLGGPVDFFNYARGSANFPLSLISSNTANITVINSCRETPCPASDRMVIHKYELTYPRQFNFGGSSNFEFKLPASASGNYLEINNFSFGTVAPVLYDLTNGKRYVGEVSGSTIKLVLAPSSIDRNLVLVSEQASNINTINSLQQRAFINYTAAENQGDYLIITNEKLFTSSTGANPIEDYKAYRSSSEGGGYNVQVYTADEIIDQFGFGIKKNPLGIRNFLMYARQKFTVLPKHVFIIGKGVNYVDQRYNEANTNMNLLDMVPTYGWPASDALLVANPGSSQPEMSIGRISVIKGDEVSVYLDKVKEFELAQKTPSPNRIDKEWMKNVVHMNGISEPDLKPIISSYFDNYKKIISDTLYGGNVTTFTKSTTDAVEQISSSYLQTLFKDGISLMTYFGHSSSSTLEFNLENPESYDNKGKYPMFIVLGCNVGNFFSFNAKRLIAYDAISEKYNLAKDKGTIGFVASSYLGIVHYLNIWNTKAYQAISSTHYGESMGDIMKATAKSVFDFTTQDDFYARANVEESVLQSDPAVKLNPHPKPDYVVDEQLLKVTPEFVSISEPFVTLKVKFINIGKAINQDIVAEVRRQYPNGNEEVVKRQTITALKYADSLSLTLPIDALRDKGTNKITVTIDADNVVDEIFESNNKITKEIIIYEDELKPVYPQNFAIVNRQNIKLISSTANPFATAREYKMEIDTTELFNSPIKIAKSINSSGGVIEFEPGINFSNNTVYYWRVGQVNNGNTSWNNSSFVYLANHEIGFNQSHFFQNKKSTYNRIYLSEDRKFKYSDVVHNIFARNTVFPTGGDQEGDFTVALDGNPFIRSACVGFSLIFNVIDPKTFKPWKNVDASGNSLFLYGSGSASCAPSRNWNFEFSYMSLDNRKKMVDFMNAIPDGAYVVVRNIPGGSQGSNTYAKDWMADTATLGSNKSLYHSLKNAGFTDVDSFYKPRVFIFIYKKAGNNNFLPKSVFSEGIYDKITLTSDVTTPSNNGAITSTLYGPAKKWKRLYWNGNAEETVSTDNVSVDVIGVEKNGSEALLYQNISLAEQDFDISTINTAQFPYLKLRLNTQDTVNYSPYQLNYWRVTYEPVPEGALAPNIYYSFKDTLEIGEPFDFKVAFKNISETAFDSVKVKMVVTDANNIQHVLPIQKYKPLVASDTIIVRYNLDTRSLQGLNNLYVEVNPDNDQPEQYHFNNYAYKSFFVGQDFQSPLLDVTFDNTHILNNDIVSSKPSIVIQLKDEAKYNRLIDTSVVGVKVRFPSGVIKPYTFTNDTLRFTPAQPGNNSENLATVNFNPFFNEDGTYELIISGKDRNNNQAGTADYKVSFEVINKPMISNMLNYPNPFTTSTAFVFTLTGSVVPQEFKIQIMTVTGKVVKEVTKQELGNLHIGRNITEYKWDGTDQYGQKLANGVYLYRVITSLDGKSLEKYKSPTDNTDKFFNKGYGKMYLMR